MGWRLLGEEEFGAVDRESSDCPIQVPQKHRAEGCFVELDRSVCLADSQHRRNLRWQDCGERNRSAPLLGAHVPGMTREKPVMAIEVLGSILQFTILSLVQIFYDGGSGRFGSLKVCLDVFDGYG